MTELLTTLQTLRALPQTPTPCLARLDARPWQRTMAFRTGPLHVGVRVDTERGAREVEQLLLGLRVPELDDEVAPNFSVELGKDERRGSQRLHLVYRDHEIVSRRRSREELLLDLVELLDDTPKAASLAGTVFASCVLTPDGQAILVPGRYHKALLTRAPQLQSRGLELLRGRSHVVDPASAAVVHGVFDRELAALVEHPSDSRTVEGSFEMRAWCVAAVGTEPFALGSALGVFTAFPMMVRRSPDDAGQGLRSLAEMSDRVPFVGLPDLSPQSLVRAITDLADGRVYD